MKRCLSVSLNPVVRLALVPALLVLAVGAFLDASPVSAAQAAQEDGGSELTWLFAVFAITWAVFFGYVFMTSRRQREMQQEIDELRRAVQEREQE